MFIGKTSAIKFSGHLKTLYINTHHTLGQDNWPPDQPKHFTNLVLLQQKHWPTQECVMELEEETTLGNIMGMMSLAKSGNSHSYETRILKEHLKKSKVTKSISEMLMVLESPNTNPRTLLIEGAPGMGKTHLIKHIVFEWANGNLLKSSQFIFLLCLRDPAVQSMSSINDLVLYFYKQDRSASKQAKACCTYLLNSGGKNITFLLDGFDELPVDLQSKSFAVSILHHEIFPGSSVVVTSRPHATAYLHNKVACLITIMGFEEEDRKHFIQHSLTGRPEKISEILDYLDNHPTVDSICYVPFNLTVLLFLCKKGFGLPDNVTQLYEYFICFTIRRYLAKHKIVLTCKFKNLDGLTEPFSTIIDQLAAFSYKALSRRKITFTLDELSTACPECTKVPEGLNGLGLLQAIQHLGLMETTTTVNFLHLSLQEFLAAYHIAHLNADDELIVLHERFLDKNYLNTFSFYLGLTKCQHRAFKYYIYGGGKYFRFFTKPLIEAKLSTKFLEDTMTTLLLFKYFYEAGEKSWCDEIAKCRLFYDDDGNPACYYQGYPFTNLWAETIGCLLTCRKQWQELNFYCNCTVEVSAFKFLRKPLVTFGSVIHKIFIHSLDPYLTTTQCSFLTDIVISCKTKILCVNYSSIDDTDWIINILSHSSCVLEVLDFSINKVTSTAVIKLLSFIKTNNCQSLKTIDISYNPIDDKIVPEIVACLQQNCFLKNLRMEFGHYFFSRESILLIVQSLKNNDVLESLYVSAAEMEVYKEANMMVDSINRKRLLKNLNPVQFVHT